jgi:peptidyl-prolyl cis-trans isomerase C
MKLYKSLILVILIFCNTVCAADNIKPSLAIVNGIKIESDLFEQILNSNIAQGNKDTTELREFLKNEIITREVLTQEANKLGLDKNKDVQNQLLLQKQALLSELLVRKNTEKTVVTDDQLKAEYKRQTEALAGSQQYLISQIVVQTETEAKDIIKSLQAGQAFDKLAKEKSIDPSKQNSGSLGWVLPNQIIPILSNVATNLNKGSFTISPIQTQFGWHILKLDDKRPFKAPTFEEAKPQLMQAVQAQLRADYVQKLVKAAKIESK